MSSCNHAFMRFWSQCGSSYMAMDNGQLLLLLSQLPELHYIQAMPLQRAYYLYYPIVKVLCYQNLVNNYICPTETTKCAEQIMSHYQQIKEQDLQLAKAAADAQEYYKPYFK